METLRCGIAGAVFGCDEAEGDQFVWVVKLEEVLPVFVVEAGQRCQDQDALLVRNRVRCGCDIVEMVVDDWRWRLYLCWFFRAIEG